MEKRIRTEAELIESFSLTNVNCITVDNYKIETMISIRVKMWLRARKFEYRSCTLNEIEDI